MKRLKIIILAFLISATAHAEKDIHIGTGSYWFSDGLKPIKVWYHCPKKLSKTTPVCFVMHGVKRDGQRYRDSWIEIAEKGQFLLLVPEFDNKNFPKSRTYNLGNIFDRSGNYNDPKHWSYSMVDEIFNSVVEKLGLQTKQYSIYGHSAGAQFVHRLAIFCPSAKFKVAISANAGWYTFLNDNVDFPYGVDGTKLSKTKIKGALKKNLIILLGTEDVDPNHKYLKNTDEAKAQGAHRFARGTNFYSHASYLAEQLKTPFNWKLIPVPGISHSNSIISKEAAKYIN